MKIILLFLRSFFFLSVLIVLTIFFAILSLVSWLLPDKQAYACITTWSSMVIFFAKTICGIHYSVTGLENLPSQNGIVLCKHQSAWETLFLQKLLPQQTWVLKRELLWIPFFGWGLARLKPIAIRRNNAQSIIDLRNQGEKALSAGRWVVIFPEGTRVRIGESKRYSRSGVILAQETLAPIVPIAHNAGLFWPKNSFLKYPGTIEVVIGPVFYPQHYESSQALNEAISMWIETTSTRLSLPHKEHSTR